jgi:hypothetical protein
MGVWKGGGVNIRPEGGVEGFGMPWGSSFRLGWVGFGVGGEFETRK